MGESCVLIGDTSRQIGPSLPLEISRFARKNRLCFGHTINPGFIDQKCSIKMAGDWPVLVFAFLLTSTSSLFKTATTSINIPACHDTFFIHLMYAHKFIFYRYNTIGRNFIISLIWKPSCQCKMSCCLGLHPGYNPNPDPSCFCCSPWQPRIASPVAASRTLQCLLSCSDYLTTGHWPHHSLVLWLMAF